MRRRFLAVAALCGGLCAVSQAATRVLVTVVEQKTGAPVMGLEAKDFAVFDDKTPRQVESVEFTRATLDIMLLLDTSLAGGMVQPLAENFVSQLAPKEQMAVVGVHSSADLLQDFTSSRELILRAISQVKYGNQPKLVDALYAAIDEFQNSPFRRVILLLTAGVEGYSRMRDRDAIRLARRNQVSIYPVYMVGSEKSMFETLARETGGASFNLRDMKKAGIAQPGARVFEVLRAHYTLSVGGNLGLGEKLRVEVRRPEKLQVSAMPIE
jgi:VWFA-related protein